MVILAAAIGILIEATQSPALQTGKPQQIDLQPKVYPLTRAMEVLGDGSVLDGHGATLSASKGNVALHIGASAHVTVKNLKIQGFATGIVAQGSPSLSLSNVTVVDCGTGLQLEKCSDGWVQGIQVHDSATGVEMKACSKVIFEKSDLSRNSQFGLLLSGSSSCVIRDNKIAAIGEAPKSGGAFGIGIGLVESSNHNQILRNVAVRCRTAGISLSLNGPGNMPSIDDTFDGNDVSWTVAGQGFYMDSAADTKIFDTTAGFCRVGIRLRNASNTLLKGNLTVGNSEAGIEDDGCVKSAYDTNVFVHENGGPIALRLIGSSAVQSNIRVFHNVFMDYAKPLWIENASPVTLQTNTFPDAKSTELDDIATVVGKKPLALDSLNSSPKGEDFVTSVGPVASVPTIYDRVGGISASSGRLGEYDIVVEGSLTGNFQGEEETIASYKGELPVDIIFPPRFEAQVRVRLVGEKPVFLPFLALLGDNSVAKDLPADDSGDTLFTPQFAVDGDMTTPDHYWKPPKGKAGDWWEVDLKHEQSLNAFSIRAPAAYPNDFWTKFHIAVSSTGLFQGEEKTVVTETNFSQRPGPMRVYTFPSTPARYIRIYGDQDQDGVKLQKFGAYGIKR